MQTIEASRVAQGFGSARFRRLLVGLAAVYLHGGLLQLTSYFIDWYKSGSSTAPAPPGGVDHLYYAYRTHPADAVATNDPAGPVTSRYGVAEDVLYVTTLTTAPAELRVTSDTTMTTRAVPAGLHHEKIPFNVGAQHFELWRNNAAVLTKEGEPIIAQPKLYNFIYTSGAAP